MQKPNAITMTFSFKVSLNEDVTTEKEAKEEMKAIKKYIEDHVRELTYQRNYATTINKVIKGRFPSKG